MDTPATSELLRQTVEAKNNAKALLTSVQNVVGVVENAAREQLQARPYLTMSAAAGAGYVLAGGLASSITRRLISSGVKAATALVVGVVLKKAGEAAGAMAPNGDDPTAPADSSPADAAPAPVSLAPES